MAILVTVLGWLSDPLKGEVTSNWDIKESHWITWNFPQLFWSFYNLGLEGSKIFSSSFFLGWEQIFWANYNDLSTPVGHPKMVVIARESPQNAQTFRFRKYSNLPRNMFLGVWWCLLQRLFMFHLYFGKWSILSRVVLIGLKPPTSFELDLTFFCEFVYMVVKGSIAQLQAA